MACASRSSDSRCSVTNRGAVIAVWKDGPVDADEHDDNEDAVVAAAAAAAAAPVVLADTDNAVASSSAVMRVCRLAAASSARTSVRNATEIGVSSCRSASRSERSDRPPVPYLLLYEEEEEEPVAYRPDNNPEYLPTPPLLAPPLPRPRYAEEEEVREDDDDVSESLARVAPEASTHDANSFPSKVSGRKSRHAGSAAGDKKREDAMADDDDDKEEEEEEVLSAACVWTTCATALTAKSLGLGGRC